LKPANEDELGVQLNVAEWLTGALPDPLSVIINGEFVAVLVTVTPPERLPVVTGANVTLKEVDWPAARLTGSEKPVALNPAPLSLICEMDTPELPVFAKVTVCAELVPVVIFPKLNDAGVGVICSTDEAPDPERETTDGEFGELFISVKLPEKLLAALGVKPTVNADVPPGGTDIGAAIPERLKPVPASDAWFMLRFAVPGLLTVNS
jgi:hypothetical protein